MASAATYQQQGFSADKSAEYKTPLTDKQQQQENYDPESGQGFSVFHDKVVRQGFMRKVFTLVSLQLAVTTGFIALFVTNATIQSLVLQSPGMLISAIVVQIAAVVAISCCPGAARRYPTNYGLLALLTLAVSYLVGVICTQYTAQSVVAAFGSTAGITVGLALFAMQTKVDFTVLNGCCFAFFLSLLLLGVMAAVFRDQLLTAVYNWVGALLFSLYIVIDVQMICGGSHSVKFGVDDYVFAATNLYMDIINLFLKLLALFGKKK